MSDFREEIYNVFGDSQDFLFVNSIIDEQEIFFISRFEFQIFVPFNENPSNVIDHAERNFLLKITGILIRF